jgi:serine/threonine protein kinase
MAPEVANASLTGGNGYSFKCDVFSAACVMYNMCTGGFALFLGEKKDVLLQTKVLTQETIVRKINRLQRRFSILCLDFL